MGWKRLTLVLGVLTLATCMASEVRAQGRNFGRQSVLDNTLRRPTVSPYLNLLQQQGLGLPNYQTLVRPQIEQRQTSQRQSQQLAQLQNQVARNAVADRAGDIGIRATGHTSVFMNYLHYYTMPTSRGRR